MTKQSAFNKVWRWFIRDGHGMSWDVNNDGQCMFRGPRGAKCAVGVLIPNRLYKKEMEEPNLRGIMVRVPSLKPLGMDFLSELQSCHDAAVEAGYSPFKGVIRKNLTTFAEVNSLNIPKNGKKKVKA